MSKRILNAVLCSFALQGFFAAASTAVPVPGKIDDIPLYKGAVRNQADEKYLARDATSWAKADNAVSKDLEVRVYDLPGALGEDVFLWYMNKFGLTISKEQRDGGEGQGPVVQEFDVKTKPGTSSRISWGISKSDDVGQVEYKGGAANDAYVDAGDEKKGFSEPPPEYIAAFQKKSEYIDKVNKEQRKPLNGIYLGSGRFTWYGVDAGQRIHHFEVEVVDRSFKTLKYLPKSAISIASWTYPAPQASEITTKEREDKDREIAEEKANDEKRMAYAATIPAGEPTAAYLGFSPYPGAVYNKEFGDKAHAGGNAHFMWTTGDPGSKVAAFFAKDAGSASMPLGPGIYSLRFTKGKNLVMIVIQETPKGQKGGGATVIQVILTPTGG